MLSQFRCDTPSLRVSWHRQDSNLLTGLPNYNPNKLNTMKNSRCALRSVPFASAIFTDHRGKANKLCYVTLCNLLKLPRLTLLPPLWRAAIKKHIMRIVVYAVIVLLIPHRSGFYQLG